MVRQAALTMMRFDEEGVMPAMVFFLRHLVAHIRQYVILMGADRVLHVGTKLTSPYRQKTKFGSSSLPIHMDNHI